MTYHVEVEGHFYSVAYRFARSEVEVRLTGRTVEMFVKGKRIAVHMRSSGNGKHTTAADHMPSSHRRCADWTIARIRRDAASSAPPPRRCLISSWSSGLTPSRASDPASASCGRCGRSAWRGWEAAATSAIEIGAITYSSLRNSRI
jgi:hypothetical protein